jgi:hypothetical protein
MNNLRPKYSIISSALGQSMVFVTDQEKEDYEREHTALIRKHQQRIRCRYGIWAGNQSKFVKALSDLNEWDNPIPPISILTKETSS